MNGNARVILSVLLIGIVGAGLAHGQVVVPEHMRVLVSEADCSGGYGRIGGFDYDPTTNNFYIGLFGYGTGFRIYDADGDVSWQAITPTDLELFARSTDPFAGDTSPDHVSNTLIFGVTLNPTPVTISVPDPQDMNTMMDVTYQAGELVIATNQASDMREWGIIPRPDATKAVFRWDLRQIDLPTDKQPDYDTAAFEFLSDPSDPGSPKIRYEFGEYEVVDWNDTFTACASNQDFRDAAAAHGITGIDRTYVGRTPTWSSDGTSLYVVHHGKRSQGAGIYKIDVATGDTTLALPVPETWDPDNRFFYCEPAVVHTSVRDLSGGAKAEGDQVLMGYKMEDNRGGISYMLDDGTSSPKTLQPLITGDDLRAQLQLGVDEDGDPIIPSVRGIGTDDEGNIFFYESETYSIQMYDTKGRLVALRNKPMQYALNISAGDDWTGGGSLRIQTRTVQDPQAKAGSMTEVMYRANNKYVAGLLVYRPGDYNRDDLIDTQDTQFFIDQYEVGVAAGGDPNSQPWFRSGDPNAGDDFMAYMRADMNGNANMFRAPSGSPYRYGGMANIAVDFKDFEVLQQFINWVPGDANWDGAVDVGDLGVLASNWQQADLGVFKADFNNDGVVDVGDLGILASQWSTTYTLDADAVALVPEPTSLAILLVVGAGAATRRRRA